MSKSILIEGDSDYFLFLTGLQDPLPGFYSTIGGHRLHPNRIWYSSADSILPGLG